MNILYWCPYLSNVVTVKAVLNSAISVKQYSKNNLTPEIINIVMSGMNIKNTLKEMI